MEDQCPLQSAQAARALAAGSRNIASRLALRASTASSSSGRWTGLRRCFFIDPPYYGKGSRLYLNVPLPDYHERLAEKLRGIGDGAVWVLTYDDCPEVRNLYEEWANIQSFSLRYTAAERRQGEEVLITPKALRTPLALNLAGDRPE